MAMTAASPPPQGRLHAAFRHRGFALFWGAALVSNTGTWLGNLTVPYVLFQSTGRAEWVGIAVAAQFGPALLLSPFGGLLADSVDRRALLMWTQTGLGAVAALMWLQWSLGMHSPGLLIALLTLSGVCNGINNPAWQSLVNDLVPRGDVLSAVTLNSLQFNLARAIGPAIAGVLLAGLGASWAFFLNAVSFSVVVVALMFIRPHQRPRSGAKRSSFAAQWGQALRHFAASRPLVLAVGLCCLVGLAGNPIFSLTVVLAETVYDTDAVGLGWLTASLGAGALLFALAGLLGSRPPPSMARRLLVALVLLGLGHLALGLFPHFAVGVAAALAIGAAFLAAMSTLNTVIQLLAPDGLRGRLLALRHMAFSTSVAVGGLLSGVAAQAWGVLATTLVLGVVFVLAAAALAAAPRLVAVLNLNVPRLQDG